MSFAAQVQVTDDEQQLVDLLHRYLPRDQEDGLRVHVPWNLPCADSMHEILYRERKDKPTSFYDPERRILTVKARGEHFRRRVSCVVYNFFLAGCLTGFLTGSEGKLLRSRSSVQFFTWKREHGREKGPSWWKSPDASIVFRGKGPYACSRATMVFKVGISEDWEDMLVDKEQ